MENFVHWNKRILVKYLQGTFTCIDGKGLQTSLHKKLNRRIKNLLIFS